MRSYGLVAIGLAAIAIAQPGAAQDSGLVRRAFAFFDRNLTVEVVGEGSGVLHVVRGGRDRVEVSGRTELGTPAFAMTGWKQDRLRLSGAGMAQEYVVIVPEDVRLEVVLPPGQGALPATSGAAATYRWPVTPQPAEAYVPEGGTSSWLAYEYGATPDVLLLEGVRTFEKISVRTGANSFRVSGSRALEIAPRGEDALGVRAAEAAARLLVELPGSVRDFVLVADGVPVVEVAGGVIRVHCSPSTRQVLSGGREWVEISPSGGRLQCGSAP